MITSKQRAFLRGKANDLDAIFQIGKDGINDNMIAQLGDVLEARELIKIKVLETAMLTAREASEAVCAATGAEPVQCIGSKFVIYRPNSEKPVIILPKA
ncbi:MAG: ribosome assembly RNA-binding protein YhbY [Clostridia bacterium]|nr:ribosome assembly RNA-binding protein YhbY [Clostridia bacterium]MBQ3092196.1 ribosome assembly RNA-binding protein YhbY [Clostridia bacterium]MBQ9925887.1 ribosome assembly RNA-binding protein YhbY [Clostridia bacterium]